MSQKVKIPGYYVYEDVRQDGSVFYVGKGKGNRFYNTMRNHNHRWRGIVVKEKGFTRRLVESGLSEAKAFELEIKLIAKYGRKQLANATSGGDGGVGIVRSEEHRRKNRDFLIALNKSRTGIKLSKEHVQSLVYAAKYRKVTELEAARRIKFGLMARELAKRNIGRKVSDETRAKLSAAGKGRKPSALTIQKLIERNKARKKCVA